MTNINIIVMPINSQCYFNIDILDIFNKIYGKIWILEITCIFNCSVSFHYLKKYYAKLSCSVNQVDLISLDYFSGFLQVKKIYVENEKEIP